MVAKKLSFIITAILLSFFWFWTNPTPKDQGTIKVFDKNGQLLHQFSEDFGYQQSAPLRDLPQNLQDAVIVTEDQRFWFHPGIDPLAIFRALYTNLKKGEIFSGASTIPQQLVRFTVIHPNQPAKFNLIRKIRESLMAIRLTLTTKKSKVLEMYLNRMHFGRQTYGVKAASQIYFGKPVNQISLSEAALLAALISNPTAFDPLEHPENATTRRNQVLKHLFAAHKITAETYQRAQSEPLPEEINQPEFIAPHAVYQSFQEAKKLIKNLSQDIEIYTTLDANWYSTVKQIANTKIAGLKDEHDVTNAAVVIIQNDTGEILTLLGSLNYFDAEIGGQNDMSLALRQPGSALKPITYAAAFEKGIATPATLIEDIQKTYLTKTGEGFIPHNYDGRYRGPVLVREALASSYNLPAVEMLDRVGIDNFLSLAHRLGITSMQQTDRYDLALTLGGGEINLLELTNAYASLARDGHWLPTNLIKNIKRNGVAIYQQPQPTPTSVLDPKVAWLITDILSDSKARIPTFGEKNSLVLSNKAAVKTGTTTDWHDNWTIGYTKDYTVGVWIGNADNHPMKNITGVTGAAPIWHDIFEQLLTFNEYTPFTQPEGIVTEEVCSWDGLLPNSDCNEKYLEVFISGSEPNTTTILTKKTASGDPAITILSPKAKAIYEIGSLPGQKLSLEITPSEKISAITWTVDGQKLPAQNCPAKLSCSWQPTFGPHVLNALVVTSDSTFNLGPVPFSVVEYNSDMKD